MNHTPHQTDISPSRPWRSWSVVVLVGLVAGLALVQVPGSDVSAATLEAEPIELEQPLEGARAPLPEILGALPFP